MGSPAKMKKHYDTPRRPWDKERLEGDKSVIKAYGLRRKQEMYRTETAVRQIRRRARKLFAERDPEKESVILKKMYDMGLTEKDATLEKVLSLNMTELLERRLQTIVQKKKLANSLKQARQFITHGHIMVGGRKVTSPSHLVSRNDEDSVAFVIKSTLTTNFKYADKESKPKEMPAEKVKEIKAETKTEPPKEEKKDDAVVEKQPKEEVKEEKPEASEKSVPEAPVEKEVAEASTSIK